MAMNIRWMALALWMTAAGPAGAEETLLFSEEKTASMGTSI